MGSFEENINFTREAFLNPVNLGLLTTSAILAFFLNDVGLLSNIIFTLALGAELLYLGIVPQLPRFQKKRRLRKLRPKDHATEERLIFQELNRDLQHRFLVLKHMSKLIKQQFDKQPYTSRGLLDNIKNKIDKLLSNYLTLLDINQRYAAYIDSRLEEKLNKEIEKEKELIKQHESEHLRNTRKRRISILEKRLRKFRTAREKSLICDTHLDTIEDAIHYIYEQSLTMSNSKEVGFELDNLLAEVEETSEIIGNLEENLTPDIELDDFDFESNYHKDDSVSTKKPVKNN